MKDEKMMLIVVVLVLSIVGTISLVYGATVDTNPASLTTSLVNQDPTPAIAGDVVDVRIGIINNGGGAITDLQAELEPSYPFDIAPGENLVQDVGTINAYQGSTGTSDMKIITYKIKVNQDATAGTYNLKVKYYDSGSTDYAELTLPIAVSSSQNAEVIHIDKTILSPGKTDTMLFRINNVGNSPLRDLTFYWTNDGNTILPVGSDNTRYVKYIDIGNSTDLEYTVVADSNAVAGLYKLNLYLSYHDSLNNSQKTISTIAGIYVGGQTDFDVALSDSSTGQTSLSIANIGSNPATSVSVSIPNQAGWRATGSSTSILGNLNKGDYTIATFKLQSTAASSSSTFNRTRTSGTGSSSNPIGATGANPDGGNNVRPGNGTGYGNSSANQLAVQIAYTDTTGTRQTIMKYISVNPNQITSGNSTFSGTRGSSANQGFLATYWIYLVILVVLIGGYIAYKKYGNKGHSVDTQVKDIFKTKKK